jgi:hypothetical protein
MANEVVVAHHFLHGVRKGDRHSKRKALGHSHDNDRHSIEKELDRAFIVDFLEREAFIFNAPSHQKYDEGADSNSCTNLADGTGDKACKGVPMGMLISWGPS